MMWLFLLSQVLGAPLLHRSIDAPDILFLCAPGYEDICVQDGAIIAGDTIYTVVTAGTAELHSWLVGPDGMIEDWEGQGGYACYRGGLEPGFYSFWCWAENDAGQTFRSVVFRLE